MQGERRLSGTLAATALSLALIVGALAGGGRNIIAQTDPSTCGPEQTGPLCSETRTCYFFIFCGEPTKTYWPAPEPEDGDDGAGDGGEPALPTSR